MFYLYRTKVHYHMKIYFIMYNNVFVLCSMNKLFMYFEIDCNLTQ